MKEFPVQEVRDQFPGLKGSTIFFDNAAGTQVPNRVIEAVSAAFTHAASNVGGQFQASRDAIEIRNNAYDAMADMLGGASRREILVGQSMTMLTFQISRSLGRSWQPGDEIIVTRMDHEGNVSPWTRLAEERGLVIRWLPFNLDTWRIEPEDLKPLLNSKTRLLALNYASNMTGSINPVAELTALAKTVGALVYLDGVQYAPHGLVDVQKLGCDFFACSAYKFCGPHLGVLWGRESILADLYPYAVRTAPQELPSRHQTGTQQTEMLAGLSAAVDYLAWLGEKTGATGSRRELLAGAYTAATAYENKLVGQLVDGLEKIPGLKIHGITNPAAFHERVPTVSMTIEGHTTKALASALGDHGINVWCGNVYSVGILKQLNLDEEDGMLRIALVHYNTTSEVEQVISVLKSLVS